MILGLEWSRGICYTMIATNSELGRLVHVHPVYVQYNYGTKEVFQSVVVILYTLYRYYC
jgi:hypothetical protein